MKEYKIYVKDEKTNIAVQEHSFTLGWDWGDLNDPEKGFLRAKPNFLFFGRDGHISYVNNDFIYFRDNNKTELTPEEFMRLKPKDIMEKVGGRDD